MTNKPIQITVRNVDPLLKRRIDQMAKLKQISINDLALEALRDKVFPAVGNVSGATIVAERPNNWTKYAGTASTNDFDDSVFDDFEAIDPKMWR